MIRALAFVLAVWLTSAAIVQISAASGSATSTPATLEAATALAAQGKLKDAYAIYRQLAAAGNAEATYRLAEAHRTGQAIPIDLPEAICGYLKAARLGHKQAQRRIIEVFFYAGFKLDPGGSDEQNTYRLYFRSPNPDFFYLRGKNAWDGGTPIHRIFSTVLVQLAADQGNLVASVRSYWRKQSMNSNEFAAATKIVEAWRRGEMKAWSQWLLATP